VLRSDGSVLACEPIPGFLLDMVDAGGLLPQLKRRLTPSKESR
jgi:3-isopropylmalate/(R)-2-methylmalate dehydratase small subunit